MTTPALSTNGLVMPPDFPTAQYEAIHKSLNKKASAEPERYQQFAAAWNAVSYRYLAMAEDGETFSLSLKGAGAHPSPGERYNQERALFGFFTNGFSVFEASFYGLFAIGAFLKAEQFPLSTAKDQQAVSPINTKSALTRAFPGHPLLTAITALFDDVAYREWREIRNVLTHRAAPGRTFYVTLEGSEAIPDKWKLLDIPLDDQTTPLRRTKLAALLGGLLSL